MNSESATTWTEADEKVFEELSKRRREFEVQKRNAARKALSRHLAKFFFDERDNVRTPLMMTQVVTEYGPELVKVLDEIGVEFPAKPLSEKEIQWVCLTDGEVGVMIRGRIYVCYKAESLLVTGSDGQRYWIPNKRELGESLKQPLYTKWLKDHKLTEAEATYIHLQCATPWRDDSVATSPVNPLPIPTLDSNTSKE